MDTGRLQEIAYQSTFAGAAESEPPEHCAREEDHRWVLISENPKQFTAEYGTDWRAIWNQMPIGKQIISWCEICHTLLFHTVQEN